MLMESDWTWKILGNSQISKQSETQMNDMGTKSCEDGDFKLWFEGLEAVFLETSQHKKHSTMVLESVEKEISLKRPKTR